MSTFSGNVAALYEDVVADLIPYYDNAVLLPNPSLIMNTYNIQGGVGDTMKIPVTNSWSTANSSVGENSGIIAASPADADFKPTSVSLQVGKRGIGVEISEESLEDGGFETVRAAVLTRISRALAQSTDQAGFTVMASGTETAMTDISDLNVSNDGYANSAITTADVALVFSPEAGAYAMKRQPTVKMFNDVDKDNYQMVATVRNGFAQVKTDFIRAIATSDQIGAAANVSASLDQFATSVAHLRAANAPTTAEGFYIACVTPAQELALAKELNGVGGISSGSIGSVAQLAANDALLQGLISYAIGCQFVRSNNLPSGLASA